MPNVLDNTLGTPAIQFCKLLGSDAVNVVNTPVPPVPKTNTPYYCPFTTI